MQSLIALIHQYVPMSLVHQALEATGVLAILAGLLPKFVAWGAPAATRAADSLAGLALASPLAPLILHFAPAIIKFLRDLLAALEQIAQTFEAELEKKIAAAAEEQKKDAPENPTSAGGAPQAAVAPPEPQK